MPGKSRAPVKFEWFGRDMALQQLLARDLFLFRFCFAVVRVELSFQLDVKWAGISKCFQLFANLRQGKSLAAPPLPAQSFLEAFRQKFPKRQKFIGSDQFHYRVNQQCFLGIRVHEHCFEIIAFTGCDAADRIF